MAYVAQDPHGSSPRFWILGLKQLTEQVFIHLIESPAYPKGFQQMVLILGVIFVQIGGPSRKVGKYLLGIPSPEFPSGAVTATKFRKFKVIQKHRYAGSIDFGRRYQRTRGVSYPINPSMHVITERIPCVMLHMSDQHIVPINDVKRTIRSELHIHRTEIRI